ncbi:motA/TolQ/ExbB proton channel family protein [Candidatus Pelagibacter sp. IMCC9063]|uniref:protein TolQ n=1 Tax=Pelagibacter sp. (strain IMCC9063) TaxID=1002672 RepID=UPI000204659B|nr:protein TolQ [Candidatus Pelagibacter sp. IMCC9063]AEA81897.1 motA/TolQ/ExbB proton channel family protein [Candidatus Pelagibacter sp. IMCC9063]
MDPVTTAATSLGTTDFSILTLFMRADLVVKFVMISLVLASIFSWALIIDKIKIFKKIFKETDIAEDQFWSSKSAGEFYKKTSSSSDNPLVVVFRAGMECVQDHKSKGQIVERTKRVMDVAIDKQIEKYEKNLTFLATVGSVAPFVGLFGTVWGIMNSFQSIAISRNTSLAIVAPGIAEALFATALGLLAAIPAVVAYNKFSSDSRRYTQKLENFTQSFLTII